MSSTYKTTSDNEASLPPPPPPPPSFFTRPNEEAQHQTEGSGGQPKLDLVYQNTIKPHMKMRTLNWRRIPKKKVLNQNSDKVSTTFDNTNFDRRRLSLNGSSIRSSKFDSICEESDDENKNVWFLIAKENKSIKEVEPSSNTNNTCHEPTTAYTSKSASKIREMLESVRRRMAAVTSDQPPDDEILTKTLEERRKRESKSVTDAIDFDYLESLFCLNNQPPNESLDLDHSPNFIRRLSMRTTTSSDSVISSSSYCNDSSNNGDDDDLLFELENILDSKKSLNVNIFLKQMKNPQKLIDRINQDDRSYIGKERLENLLKLLPDESEKSQLMKYYLKNKHNRLPVAEKFLTQLITEVPNLALRIRSMLLQEQYSTDLEAIGPDLDKIEEAAKEIKSSKMLRDLLNLVLVMGNFLNSGGYAADAAGFSLDCLDRLNEVRSNKPGFNLIHYVADVANKLNLIEFKQKELPHVELASKVCIESIKSDLSSMMGKITELKRDTEKVADTNFSEKDNQLFLLNLLRSLDYIKCNVEFLTRRTTHNLEATRKNLAKYLCEDPTTFKLHDCFHNILTFSQRLKSASEENERRQKAEKSSCSLKRSNTINPRILKKASSRSSLGDSTAQPRGFSYSNAGVSDIKRSSFGYSTVYAKSSLSRATSTFNLSNTNSDTQEFDQLHNGLLKVLEDTHIEQTPENQIRKKTRAFESYRHASKLFRMPKMSN